MQLVHGARGCRRAVRNGLRYVAQCTRACMHAQGASPAAYGSALRRQRSHAGQTVCMAYSVSKSPQNGCAGRMQELPSSAAGSQKAPSRALHGTGAAGPGAVKQAALPHRANEPRPHCGQNGGPGHMVCHTPAMWPPPPHAVLLRVCKQTGVHTCTPPPSC